MSSSLAYLGRMLSRPHTLPLGFVPPCLPTKAPHSPSGQLWLHEIKHGKSRRLLSVSLNYGIKLLSSLILSVVGNPMLSQSSRPSAAIALPRMASRMTTKASCPTGSFGMM